MEAGKFKIKALADLVSDESLLLCSHMAVFFLCPHVAEGVGELSGVPFIRTLISFMRVYFMNLSPPKIPPPNPITLGVRFQHVHLRGTQYLQSGLPQ